MPTRCAACSRAPTSSARLSLLLRDFFESMGWRDRLAGFAMSRFGLAMRARRGCLAGWRGWRAPPSGSTGARGDRRFALRSSERHGGHARTSRTGSALCSSVAFTEREPSDRVSVGESVLRLNTLAPGIADAVARLILL